MTSRTRRLAAAFSVLLLAFGVTAAMAVHRKQVHRPVFVTSSVSCSTDLTVAVAKGETAVAPPEQEGNEYGPAVCDTPLGHGLQSDHFTVADSGDTTARFTLFLPTGTVRGTYVLTPQEGSSDGTNFSSADYAGKMTVLGGTGAFRGATGSGPMTCHTDDGIHSECTDQLKVKLKKS